MLQVSPGVIAYFCISRESPRPFLYLLDVLLFRHWPLKCIYDSAITDLDPVLLRRSGWGVRLHRCDGPVWVTSRDCQAYRFSLNVLVSALVAFRFFRAGHLDWRTFWPLAFASVPAALVGAAPFLQNPSGVTCPIESSTYYLTYFENWQSINV